MGFAIGADYVPAITLLSEFVEPGKRGSSFDFSGYWQIWVLLHPILLHSYWFHLAVFSGEFYL
ncbi:hypothetical protein [Acidiplasma cupricumulans]|uniref:hypothetical protein n=1 Tax=Acidiplasma cupricumulans TaxID=312540 RepID=UPI000A5B38EC|nr:hypothetical protein [Acidiplasma cupricumulans]